MTRTYEESVIWVAEHSPDAKTVALLLIAHIYDVKAEQIFEDYAKAQEVRRQMRTPQPHEREVHKRGWREHPRRNLFLCERHGCQNPGGPHQGDPQ